MIINDIKPSRFHIDISYSRLNKINQGGGGGQNQAFFCSSPSPLVGSAYSLFVEFKEYMCQERKSAKPTYIKSIPCLIKLSRMFIKNSRPYLIVW